MANPWLADSLLFAGMRTYGLIPSSDNSATTTQLLDILNRELRSYVVPFATGINEDYFVESALVALVAGTTSYRLPSKAVASAIKSIEKVDASGANPVPLFSCQSDEVYDIGRFRAVGDYYIEGNRIILTSDPGAGAGYIKVRYARRLNRIVASATCAEVTSFNAGAKTVTYTVAPSPAFTSGAKFDLIRGSAHFDVLTPVEDVATLSGSTLTFTTALPSELAATGTTNTEGDWVAPAGQTPIANVPLELQDLLVVRCVEVYLRARSDPRVTELRNARLEVEAAVRTLIKPRVSADDRPLLNFNKAGWRTRWGGRRWS